jgi:hypothetical protein
MSIDIPYGRERPLWKRRKLNFAVRFRLKRIKKFGPTFRLRIEPIFNFEPTAYRRSTRTGGNNIFDIFTQRIDQNSAEMVVSGPEQKTIARMNPDGSQIIYLVPPNLAGVVSQGLRATQTVPQTVRVLRAPTQGGASQLILEGPDIVNFQCSRAPATICILSQSQPTSFVFSAFDLTNGSQREVAKAKQSPNGGTGASLPTEPQSP